MGFKADTSFLRFLSMGAAGVRHTIEELEELGFQPIELERYCSSNKIWQTKIKRLRLPDLLCVRTGLRIEVRAKSALEIRMSHAPNNPDRHWDAGLRNEDVVAFIACRDHSGQPQPIGHASYFTVEALRSSVNEDKLSALKAASEGSEQHLTWPATVPKRDGEVLEIDGDRIVTLNDMENGTQRRQSYQLRGKTAYVAVGDRFVADAAFIAGTPAGMADLNARLGQDYRPLDEIGANDTVDRYAAVKALAVRGGANARAALEQRLQAEGEDRVALEIAGSAASLGSQAGFDYLARATAEHEKGDLRMEAVLILSELAHRGVAVNVCGLLKDIAADWENLAGNELRQAALWGLGKAGGQAYSELVPFIADEEENVALHAIAAFGEAPTTVIDRLTALLWEGDARVAAAVSQTLCVIGNEAVLDALMQALQTRPQARAWIHATLGRLPAGMVRRRLAGSAVLAELEPFLVISREENWLAEEETEISLDFLLKQNL